MSNRKHCLARALAPHDDAISWIFQFEECKRLCTIYGITSRDAQDVLGHTLSISSPSRFKVPLPHPAYLHAIYHGMMLILSSGTISLCSEYPLRLLLYLLNGVWGDPSNLDFGRSLAMPLIPNKHRLKTELPTLCLSITNISFIQQCKREHSDPSSS